MTRCVDEAGPTVLIVEDHEDTLTLYAETFTDAGYRVTRSLTAEAALVEARGSRPRVIVADVALPGIDGLELARRLAEDARTRGIPIVAVTARTTILSSPQSAVFDRLLLKPVTPDVLIATVAAVLRRSPARDIRAPAGIVV